MAGGAEDRLHGLRIEAASPDIGSQFGGRLVRRSRRPVGTRLAHRLVCVSRAENASRL